MNNERIVEIIDTIDELMCDLLVPIRTSKTHDLKSFDKLHSLLDELKTLLKDETVISKRLVGLLFSIYVSVNTEASYTNYTRQSRIITVR